MCIESVIWATHIRRNMVWASVYNVCFDIVEIGEYMHKLRILMNCVCVYERNGILFRFIIRTEIDDYTKNILHITHECE